jgi:hypothetical protein
VRGLLNWRWSRVSVKPRRLLIERTQDCLQHAINIPHDVVVLESQYQIAHSFERIRPFGISLFILLMLPTVELDDQLALSAYEVGDEPIDRYLSPEFPSIEPAISQTKPQDALRIGLIAA